MAEGYRAAAAQLGVVLRPMVEADYAFCEALYASTRLEELAPLGWPAEAVRQFLAQQHRAQHLHYQQHYAGAQWWIVESAGCPLGRLYVFEGASDIRIVDIALLPKARGQGIGGALIEGVQRHAAAQGKRVSIHAEKNNPARSLYFRLGFVVIDADRGAYDLLEWRPQGPADQ
ncbi:MAG: GNAT family N-acetyltransferase [Sphingomonas sp.]|uniref:GNAT family N-acetyltransferase n=1 Tax=Sphingomonas sp. TaxID=28214 RepID=UPI001B05294A|nr:GNAT family N-acetyltransferase [Sphingomonas sp.]MBO9624512.1 GNAT family N-acetyltransferase [Sphingomonas sp.]